MMELLAEPIWQEETWQWVTAQQPLDGRFQSFMHMKAGMGGSYRP